MKLISMVDYVIDQGLNPLQNDVECWIKSHKYAEFLKQPLELWMFIACDEDGNVLDEPNPVYDFDTQDYDYLCQEYQQAKERCLFDISIDLDTIKFHLSQNRIVEYFVPFEIQLTKTAIKKIS